jgi:hypothetical protein
MGYITAKRSLKSGLALSLALFAMSCASNQFAKIDSTARPGHYNEALAEMDTKKDKMYPANSKIVYQLDAGMLNRYAGNYEESIELLQEGERNIEEAYTKSVSQALASGIVNDNVVDYAGEDFEDIYINVFNALSYYHLDQVESAAVEIRRMNEKLAYLSTKYQATDAELIKKAEEEGIDPDTVISKFANSALGRYLGILFFRANRDRNSMEVDRRLLTAAFQNAPDLYPFPMPSTVDGEMNIPAGSARLNIIGFSGISPIKEEFVVRVPVDLSGNYAKIALPQLLERPSRINRVELALKNGQTIDLEPIEDLSAVYKETFKRNFNFIRNRTIARAIIKAGTGAVADKVADNVGGEIGLALSILSLGAKVSSELEQADIRTSRFFPGKAWVTGVNLEPAVYSGTVRFYSGGSVVHEKPFEIEAKADNLNLIEAISLM